MPFIGVEPRHEVRAEGESEQAQHSPNARLNARLCRSTFRPGAPVRRAAAVRWRGPRPRVQFAITLS
jgi:hypothetical protein